MIPQITFSSHFYIWYTSGYGQTVLVTINLKCKILLLSLMKRKKGNKVKKFKVRKEVVIKKKRKNLKGPYTGKAVLM